MVIDGDTTSVEQQSSLEPTEPGQHQPTWDFSRLHGFQFVGPRDEAAEGGAATEDERKSALTLELGARAARFHQAVDASIVLSSDGAIRWLGDPVAKLAAGPNLLQPRALPLVDEAISEDAQRLVSARLELWLTATIQRLLGPLTALRDVTEGPKPVQDLAARVANALGVLEREPVRSLVRGLDQNSRAVLRRHGVRFGSYYLYVPTTLKPASRALSLQLWSLQNGDEELTAAAQGLIPMATSGRTSAPPDSHVNGQMYRVAGFRLCGERVVRVDIVERLADLIRAASTLRLLGGLEAGPSAFVVSGQMTSLTGCSGESFASILRALSFESLTVPRSQIIWPAAATPAAQTSAESPTAAEAPATTEAAQEDQESPDSEAATAAEDEEAAPEGQLEEIVADEAAAPFDQEAGDEAVPAPEVASATETEDNTPSEIADDALPSLEPTSDSPFEPTSDLAVDPSEPLAEPVPEAVEETSPEVAPSVDGNPGTSEEDMVTVWRFVRPAAPTRVRHGRRPHRKPAPATASSPQTDPGSEAAPTVAAARQEDGGGYRGRRTSSFDKSQQGEKRKPWEGGKGRRAPEDKRDARPAASSRTPDKRPTVDPMSPFAKLLELRARLETESKKRT